MLAWCSNFKRAPSSQRQLTIWARSYDPEGWKSRKQRQLQFANCNTRQYKRTCELSWTSATSFDALHWTSRKIAAPLNKKLQKDLPKSFPELTTEEIVGRQFKRNLNESACTCTATGNRPLYLGYRCLWHQNWMLVTAKTNRCTR